MKRPTNHKELKPNFLYKTNIEGRVHTMERTMSGTDYCRLSTGQLVRMTPKRHGKGK